MVIERTGSKPRVIRPVEPAPTGVVRPTGEPRDWYVRNPAPKNPGEQRPYPVPMQTSGVVLRRDDSHPLAVTYTADSGSGRPPATVDGKGQANTAGGNLPPVITVRPGGGAEVTVADQQRGELTNLENRIIDQGAFD